MKSRGIVLGLVALIGVVGAEDSGGGPSPRRVVGLEYPWFARMGVIEGTVELAASVAPDGTVNDVRILSGAQPLAEPASDAVRKWMFAGCRAPSKCALNITFTFRLMGSCAAGSNCPSEFQVDLPSRVRVTSSAIRAIVN
jgi:TonB family protein